MLTLPIEIGKRYKRRDGKVVTAKAPHKDFNGGTICVGEAYAAPRAEIEHAYVSSGMIKSITAGHAGREHPFDLVEDMPSEDYELPGELRKLAANTHLKPATKRTVLAAAAFIEANTQKPITKAQELAIRTFVSDYDTRQSYTQIIGSIAVYDDSITLLPEFDDTDCGNIAEAIAILAEDIQTLLDTENKP